MSLSRPNKAFIPYKSLVYIVQTEKEIKKRLVKLEIEARERRRRTERNVSIVIGLAIVFSILTYFYPPFVILDVIIYLVGVFIGIIVIGIPILAHPLRIEYRAFQRIAHATQVLEESSDPAAYREVLRDVTYAYNALSDIGLTEAVEWYKKTNEIFDEFFEDLEQIVIPAIKDSRNSKKIDRVVLVEHLKQIALAIYSLDPLKIDEVNKTLETEPSYKKVAIGKGEQGEGIGYRLLRLFRTNTVLRICLAVSSSVVGCVIFYYVLVNYASIQRDYASGEAVAAFFGLLALYVEGRRREQSGKWRDAEKANQ